MADHQSIQAARLVVARCRAPLGLLATFCALAMLAGCASEPKPIVSDPNAAVPTNYRADIIAYLRSYLNDPTGIRDAFITEPAVRPIPGAVVGQGVGQRSVALDRYMVCIRFNAKNSQGRYEGTRDRIILFLSGQLDTMTNARGDQCKDANWQPFPELEKLKR